MSELQNTHYFEKRFAKEFPVAFNPVLLCDLDKTLIDKQYKITNPDITQTIIKIQDKGYTVGLSSDTPLEALRLWRDRFGMNGPLIAERGAIIEFDGQTQIDEEDINTFSHSRNSITTFLARYNLPILSGNPVEIIKEGLPIAEPGQGVILMNTLRRASLSFFVRVVQQDRSLGVDQSLAESIIGDSLHLLPDFDDICLDINSEYGILIASRAKTAKRNGSLQYMQQKGFNQIGMIGDSITDYLGSDIAVHYAVENATQEFKNTADYVAKGQFTSGVVEILNGLL